MKLKYSLIPALIIISLLNTRAQEISPDVLGSWTIYQEVDACRQLIMDSEVLELSITDQGSDVILDTVSLILSKNYGINDTSLAVLKFNTSFPEQIGVLPIAGQITPGSQYLELAGKDSLSFVWELPCNACFCGGSYRMVNTSLVNTTTTVDENSAVWTIYPNPVKDKLYLSLSTAYYPDRIKILLLDLSGSVLKELEMEANPSDFWLGDIPSGIYYLVLQENHQSIVKKILKI